MSNNENTTIDNSIEINANTNKDYGADQIKVLKGLEAVRKRPGMYIGDTTDGTGLHHMGWEVIDNGIDEALAGHADLIRYTLNADGSVTISDNGRGIPVEIHKEEGIPTVELVMTSLHAGGKFDQDSYKVSGGLHGVGVSVVNALSSRMEVTVYRDDKEYFIAFEHGDTVEPLREVGAAVGQTGTVVTFTPSADTFENINFDTTVIERRLRELSFLNSGIRLEFQDNRTPNNPLVEFHAVGGVAEFVQYLDRKKSSINSSPIICRGITPVEQGGRTINVDVEVALQWNDTYSENLFGYTNNINQKEGGTHIQGFKTALTRVVQKYVSNNLSQKKKIDLIGEDIREGLTAIVSVKIPDPKFSSQTKEKLVSSEVTGAVSTIVGDVLTTWFDENPAEVKHITDKVVQAAVVREVARKARDQTRKKGGQEIASLPGKLSDCQEKDPVKSEVFIVEGDSAGGTAKQGRDRRNQAILPLRGKVLNVERQRMDKIISSEQIGTLAVALGCGIGKDFFNADKVRYHKIVIMTDADVDGEHIRTLLLTFFYRHMRELIDRGYVYIAQPPLFSAKKGKKMTYLLDQKSLSAHILKNGLENCKLVLNNGDEISGDELVKLAIDAEEEAQMINSLETYTQNKSIINALAMGGMMASNQYHLASDRKNVGDWSSVLLTMYDKKVKWSGESVDEGVQLTREYRGIVNKYIIPSTMFDLVNAVSLHRKREKFMRVYGPGANLVVGEGESQISYKVFDPETLYNLAFEIGSKGVEVKRYKGLGEMNDEQLWDTTLNPQTRTLLQVRVEDEVASDDIVFTLMGDNVEDRRKFIVDNSNFAEVDA